MYFLVYKMTTNFRYFVEENGKPTLTSLYEEWFHCEDLGSQLGPIIKRLHTQTYSLIQYN